MKKCSAWGLPETYETISFDGSGVCNIFTQKSYKNTNIDWADRKRQLDELVGSCRGKHDYDRIVPFSGGKDPTFTAPPDGGGHPAKRVGVCNSQTADEVRRAVNAGAEMAP